MYNVYRNDISKRKIGKRTIDKERDLYTYRGWIQRRGETDAENIV